jgi:hypothetical protein
LLIALSSRFTLRWRSLVLPLDWRLGGPQGLSGRCKKKGLFLLPAAEPHFRPTHNLDFTRGSQNVPGILWVYGLDRVLLTENQLPSYSTERPPIRYSASIRKLEAVKKFPEILIRLFGAPWVRTARTEGLLTENQLLPYSTERPPIRCSASIHKPVAVKTFPEFFESTVWYTIVPSWQSVTNREPTASVLHWASAQLLFCKYTHTGGSQKVPYFFLSTVWRTVSSYPLDRASLVISTCKFCWGNGATSCRQGQWFLHHDNAPSLTHRLLWSNSCHHPATALSGSPSVWLFCCLL